MARAGTPDRPDTRRELDAVHQCVARAASFSQDKRHRTAHRAAPPGARFHSEDRLSSGYPAIITTDCLQGGRTRIPFGRYGALALATEQSSPFPAATLDCT